MTDQARHLTVDGGLTGEYIVDEQLADGRLVIRPETSAAAMNRRLGVEPLTPEQFDEFLAEHGAQMLRPDGEG